MKGWALVTGAGRRIGRAIALDLAAHGWDIIVHYHRAQEDAQKTAEEIDAMGRAVCLAEIDLSNAQMAEDLIPSLANELGMIDALVNNASLFEPDSTDPDGTRHWAVNAEAPRILSKAFRDHLPKNEKAAIVNLLDCSFLFDRDCSVTAAQSASLTTATATPAADFTAYTKSKTFLTDITRNMAKSYAPQVRVNGVAPAYVLPSPRQTEEAFRKMAADRLTTPEQVATAVRQLLDNPTANGEIIKIP